jgi:hypothetical protein
VRGGKSYCTGPAISPGGTVDSIRVSTRPDHLEGDVLDELKSHGVATVEVGLQSLDDTVLDLSRRGHTAADGERAAGLLKERGFETSVHLMAGHPGDSPAVLTIRSAGRRPGTRMVGSTPRLFSGGPPWRRSTGPGATGRWRMTKRWSGAPMLSAAFPLPAFPSSDWGFSRRRA